MSHCPRSLPVVSPFGGRTARLSRTFVDAAAFVFAALFLAIAIPAAATAPASAQVFPAKKAGSLGTITDRVPPETDEDLSRCSTMQTTYNRIGCESNCTDECRVRGSELAVCYPDRKFSCRQSDKD